MIKRFVIMLSAVTLLIAACSPTAAASGSFTAEVNAVRINNGLATLQNDAQLTNLAQAWADKILEGACGGESLTICHASALDAGVTPGTWTLLGENVGIGGDVATIMGLLMGSPKHLANMLDPSYTHIGVGVAKSGTVMVTVHRFRAAKAAVATTTVPDTTTTSTSTSTTVPVNKEVVEPVEPTSTTVAPITTEACK